MCGAKIHFSIENTVASRLLTFYAECLQYATY